MKDKIEQAAINYDPREKMDALFIRIAFMAGAKSEAAKEYWFEKFKQELLDKYNFKRSKQPDKEKSCYCGHTDVCDCSNPGIYEFDLTKVI